MKWIGLTGCMGCGKSTVAEVLRKDHGLPVVSADEVAMSILKQDHDLHKFISLNMGLSPMTSSESSEVTDEALNKYRTEIAAKVFADAKLLKKYEDYFHPKIKEKVQTIKEDLKKISDLAFYDVPLLFEKKMLTDFDAIVGVFADADIQHTRLQERNGWNSEQIKNRIKYHIPNAVKIKQCDFLIMNNLDLNDLKIQVSQLVAKLIVH